MPTRIWLFSRPSLPKLLLPRQSGSGSWSLSLSEATSTPPALHCNFLTSPCLSLSLSLSLSLASLLFRFFPPTTFPLGASGAGSLLDPNFITLSTPPPVTFIMAGERTTWDGAANFDLLVELYNVWLPSQESLRQVTTGMNQKGYTCTVKAVT